MSVSTVVFRDESEKGQLIAQGNEGQHTLVLLRFRKRNDMLRLLKDLTERESTEKRSSVFDVADMFGCDLREHGCCEAPGQSTRVAAIDAMLDRQAIMVGFEKVYDNTTID